VAIETPRGLLVASLRATGRPVYAINPLAVARYRERQSVARLKSDHAGAMTLANILRVDAHLHRRLLADSERCQAIAVLARAPALVPSRGTAREASANSTDIPKTGGSGSRVVTRPSQLGANSGNWRGTA
jgi:hypothetical protein